MAIYCDSFVTHLTEPPQKASGTGTVALPQGMTQEDADRLVREADSLKKENT